MLQLMCRIGSVVHWAMVIITCGAQVNKNDFICPCLSVTMTFCRIDINLENNSTSFLGGVMWNTQEIELGKVDWTES